MPSARGLEAKYWPCDGMDAGAQGFAIKQTNQWPGIKKPRTRLYRRTSQFGLGDRLIPGWESHPLAKEQRPTTGPPWSFCSPLLYYNIGCLFMLGHWDASSRSIPGCVTNRSVDCKQLLYFSPTFESSDHWIRDSVPWLSGLQHTSPSCIYYCCPSLQYDIEQMSSRPSISSSV